MEMRDMLQFVAVLLALISLVWQQRRLVLEGDRKEKRVETKLRIFYVLSGASGDLTEDQIIKELERGHPLRDVDRIEIRKSLYEMLKDETIRFTRAKKYKPRRRSCTGGDENSSG
ncbi:hypothetical protein [Ferrimonas marina]|uniref:Uncharacterized protein n=1 Tax=Ferrimonas marina TaxID=299255 RepID=A0A1M5TR41_9GAMM|nr:hypothetical protein [Ferrimonas marina]SHH53237.1 hypothetical protein SAMN02745129_2246 [Ferrimonas marina]